MTEHDLTTLLLEHVRTDEPPLALSSDTAILAGRRALRRRRMRRTTGIVAAAAVVAIAVPLAVGDGGTDVSAGIDPASRRALADYDPMAMPKLLDDRVGPTVRRWAPELGEEFRFSARNDQGRPLAESAWNRASSMSIEYRHGDHTFQTQLLHARSEAEGDAREYCADALESGYKLLCEVSTTPDGDVVTTSVGAFRRLDSHLRGPGGVDWGALMRAELVTGKVSPNDPSQRPIDPDEIYFERSVEAVHSETFLTSTVERVQAPDLAHAESAWRVPVSAMIAVVTDPALVIPEP